MVRRNILPVLLFLTAIPVAAQPSRLPRTPPALPSRGQELTRAEQAVKQATEQFGQLRKLYDRDLEVLKHLQAADEALVDPMQPNIAIEKAYENVSRAKNITPPGPVYDAILRAEKVVTDARLSPMAADFGRMRTVIRAEAIRAAARVVAANAATIQDEVAGWLRIQDLVTTHLRTLTDVSAQSSRAVQ